MTDTRTELLEHLKKEQRFYHWLTTPEANAQPKMIPNWNQNAETFGTYIAYVESAAALEAENERLRGERDNVCFMIRRMHRKFKTEKLDAAFIVQMVQMANRYCPPDILRENNVETAKD